MRHALANDPRAISIVDKFARDLFIGNQERIDNFYKSVGGRGNTVNALSTLMNLPGASAYTGGDIRSIMFGRMRPRGTPRSVVFW